VGASDLEPFLDKKYRDAYLDGYVKGSIAYQIRSLREQSGLSQSKFGKRIDKPQSVVSRLESTEYGALTVNTLLVIAKARNVGLKVSFVDYVTVVSDDVSPMAMKVDSIQESYMKCSELAIKPVGASATTFVLVNPTFNITVSGTGSTNITSVSTKGVLQWQSL
jgi:transcriptional regulator with XRE-family HTH domain